MGPGGPHGSKGNQKKRNARWGAEVFAEDGTLPDRVVLQCLADDSKLLYKKEEGSNRQYL